MQKPFKNIAKDIKTLKNCQLKQVLIFVIAISFVVSAIIGFIAGSLSFELSRYANNSTFLQKLTSKEPTEAPVKSLDKNPSMPYLSQEEQVIKTVKEASPSVVSIIITKDLPVLEQYYANPFEDFFQEENNPFNDFFGPFSFNIPQYRQKGTEKKEIGGGTGFVVSEGGFILTNRHVVEDQEAEYTVLTNEGAKYPAKVLARDPVMDLAILKIDNANLLPLRLGDSDEIEIGQSVIAIGNALGEFRNTVSIGVVSGLKRTVVASSGFGSKAEELDQVIQTDAAINRGNSGGPLFNLKGEVIGVNTAMAMGAENIGFAIPINIAKKDIEDVKKTGQINYPFLGVRYVIVNKTIQEKNKLSFDYGALILRGDSLDELAVMPGSPADKAGLKENDIILKINDEKIDETNTLQKIILKHGVGEEINLTILSQGKQKEVKVKLAKMPNQ